MTTEPRGFVILGFPRSGTTLLSRLLDAHPDVSCPPETYLLSSAARFLYEQKDVEGPPVGVVSGLGFLGFGAEDVMAPLRDMVFDFYRKIAGDASVWVEKTAIDVFHLEVLEPFLAGHVRFILLTRHPLDVVGSNMDLAEVMGAQLTDIHALTKDVNSPHEGLARAWINRAEALKGFAERNAGTCLQLRYEDLLESPDATLEKLWQFMGLKADAAALRREAFVRVPQVGLGDYKVNATTDIQPLKKNGWRKKIPPAALSRIVPLLAPMMERLGYEVPRVPKPLAREDAVRQFTMAANLKRDMSRAASDGDGGGDGGTKP